MPVKRLLQRTARCPANQPRPSGSERTAGARPYRRLRPAHQIAQPNRSRQRSSRLRTWTVQRSGYPTTLSGTTTVIVPTSTDIVTTPSCRQSVAATRFHRAGLLRFSTTLSPLSGAGLLCRSRHSAGFLDRLRSSSRSPCWRNQPTSSSYKDCIWSTSLSQL